MEEIKKKAAKEGKTSWPKILLEKPREDWVTLGSPKAQLECETLGENTTHLSTPSRKESTLNLTSLTWDCSLEIVLALSRKAEALEETCVLFPRKQRRREIGKEMLISKRELQLCRITCCLLAALYHCPFYQDLVSSVSMSLVTGRIQAKDKG